MNNNQNHTNEENTAAEEDSQVITLTGDDGQKVEFELLDMINYSGTDYAVLVPADENSENADQVVIFRVEDADKDVNTLIPVANPETANAIFELFKTRNEGKFDFE